MSGYFRNDNPNNGWVTPPEVIEPVRDFFGGTIGLDPCPGAQDHALVNLRYPGADGLARDWKYEIQYGQNRYWLSFFMNPPYLPVYRFEFKDGDRTVEVIEGVAQDCQKYFTTRFNDTGRLAPGTLGQLVREYQKVFLPGTTLGRHRTDVKTWIRKALEGARQGLEGILLLPAKVESQAWQDRGWGILKTAAALCYVKGRVSYIDPATGERRDPAQHASVLVYHGTRVREFGAAFAALGHCERLGTL